jgi:molecular chaperone DnaK
MTKLIEKNTTIPTQKSQVFSTAADNQPSVEVHVLQGEREMAGDNKSLGRFVLDGIPPSPRGVPQVEVSFDLDANGILKVSAKDKATGKEQSVRIEASSGLSEEEIEKMRKDAEVHAEEDKKKREAIEMKNQAEQLVYATEKSLKEYGDKVDEETKKNIEEKLTGLKDAIGTDDTEAVKKAMEELGAAAQKLGEEMYKAEAASAEASASQAGEGSGEAGESNVKDAEFKEGPSASSGQEDEKKEE